MATYLARYSKTMGFLMDILTMVAGFFLTYDILKQFTGRNVFAHQQGALLETEALCFVSWALAIVLYMEYPSRRRSGAVRDFHSVISINLIAVLLFSATIFFVKGIWISRLFILLYVFMQVLLMFLNRYGVRLVLYLFRRAGWNTRTRLIVGTGDSARAYLEEVENNRRFGLRVIGYVADEPEAEIPISHLGSIENLDRQLTRHNPDGVVIALSVTHPGMEQAVKVCESAGVPMELLLDGLSSQIATSEVHHGNRVSILSLSVTPHTPFALLVKRVTDIILSATALALLCPLFLCIALAIKLEDGGPVLFVQERVGLRNGRFRMYKFRSMCVGAEKMRDSLLHLNEMSGPVFKLTNDPRVTKVGSFIRKTSLDELPQLWNVLAGSMSLVGPRPPLPTEVAQYDQSYRRRLSVKPGLTCLWQVAGRNDIDFDRWMELDLAYIDNWSYLEDLKIIFRTIPAVLKRHGAR